MAISNEKTEDWKLIERSASGDHRAFEELVRRYYQKAYAMALVRVGNRDAALDISQDAFIRVYRNLSHFKMEYSFGAWLYTIVNNLCKNYLSRYRKRWVAFSDQYPEPGLKERALEVKPDENETSEDIGLLYQALNKLSENDREIIILKDLQEFSYQEISEILQIPRGTVMSRLYYARKRLATIYKQLNSELTQNAQD
ncbi:MAG: sigma-70 family RNA polymerase sigma factor [Calditrichaeota bacterium]|nr:MAG: sigma-70 family RNA polymerase sigma factor [Calditrichota bacterium]